jgi:hypothetical protein
MSVDCGKFILLKVVWAVVGSYQFVEGKNYLYRSSREMYQLDGCELHGILMLHCPIICHSLFTFNGKG